MFGQHVVGSVKLVGGVGNLGSVEVLQEELDRVYVPGGYSGGYVSVVTMVMVWGGDNVPTVSFMC